VRPRRFLPAAALALLAILAPLLAGSGPLLRVGGWSLPAPVPHDPLAIDLAARLQGPGAAHWLGTDELGRDVLSRLIHAARPSLMVALLATLCSMLAGIPLGALSAGGGRRTGMVLTQAIDAVLSFPALVLLLLISSVALGAVAGAPAGGMSQAARSILIVGCAVGLARSGAVARYTRGEVIRLAGTDIAVAAAAAGRSRQGVLWRHLVPAGMPAVKVAGAFGAGSAVVAEASLSFLGLGVQPPAPTWGQMIATAASHQGCWWMLVFPGIMVALTVASFSRLGARGQVWD